MMAWGYAQNTQILFRAEIIPRKHNFCIAKNHHCLAITNTVCQIQMILTLIRLQIEHDRMWICAKHTNFIQSGNHF